MGPHGSASALATTHGDAMHSMTPGGVEASASPWQSHWPGIDYPATPYDSLIASIAPHVTDAVRPFSLNPLEAGVRVLGA